MMFINMLITMPLLYLFRIPELCRNIKSAKAKLMLIKYSFFSFL